MEYKLFGRRGREVFSAYLVTCDEKIVWSTPSMRWALGKTFGNVQGWYERKAMQCTCIGERCSPLKGDKYYGDCNRQGQSTFKVGAFKPCVIRTG